MSSPQREWWVVAPAASGPFDGITDFSVELANAISATSPARLIASHEAFVASAAQANPAGVFLQYSPPSFIRSDVVSLLAVLKRLRAQGVPVVTTVHEYWPPATSSPKRAIWRWLAKRVLAAVAARSSRMIATTPYAENHLRASGVFGATPSTVIPVGSNIPSLPRTPAHGGRITFAMFGQPYVMDRAVVLGFAEWLASLPEHDRPRWIWASRSSEEVGRWWRELEGPDDVLEVRGGLASADVAAMLASADVGLAFHDDGASTRRSSVAAMVAAGLPIVGLYGRFTDDGLRANPGLLLSPIGDAAALITNARRLVGDAGLRHAMSLETARLHETQFAWARIAEQYLAAAR